MNLRTFLHISGAIDSESNKVISSLAKPQFIGTLTVPDNLNLITYGQLLDLQRISTERDLFFLPAKILIDINETDLLEADYKVVIGFVNFVLSELTRIGNLFASCHMEPTPEERQAGCEELNSGAFGVIDWYARRMNIQDHDDVLKLGWLRIYNAMKLDKETAEYQRRLQKIYQNKNKR